MDLKLKRNIGIVKDLYQHNKELKTFFEHCNLDIMLLDLEWDGVYWDRLQHQHQQEL